MLLAKELVAKMEVRLQQVSAQLHRSATNAPRRALNRTLTEQRLEEAGLSIELVHFNGR